MSRSEIQLWLLTLVFKMDWNLFSARAGHDHGTSKLNLHEFGSCSLVTSSLGLLDTGSWWLHVNTKTKHNPAIQDIGTFFIQSYHTNWCLRQTHMIIVWVIKKLMFNHYLTSQHSTTLFQCQFTEHFNLCYFEGLYCWLIDHFTWN